MTMTVGKTVPEIPSVEAGTSQAGIIQNYWFFEILESLTEAIVTIDRDGIISFINAATIELFGYHDSELIGLPVEILMPERFRARHKTYLNNSHIHGSKIINNRRHLFGRRKNGDLFPMALTVTQTGPETGISFVGLIRDLSADLKEQKEKELAFQLLEQKSQSLKISEQKYRNIYDNAQDAIFLIDPLTCEIIDVNPFVETYLGYRPEELIGQSLGILYDPVELGALEEGMNRMVLDKTSRAVAAHISKSGKLVPVEITANLINVHGRTLLQSIVRDITVRKQNELELKRANALLENINALHLQCLEEFNREQLFQKALETLLEASHGEYGFIGEVARTAEGDPFLQMVTFSDISWSEKAKKFYHENIKAGLEFHNLDTLFGECIKTRKYIISNDARNDERAGGTPAGHPELRNFLGMPLVHNGQIIGMVGVANRPEDFTESLIHDLEPLITVLTALFRFAKADEARIASERSLRKAKHEAEDANLAKSKFLSQMSHELRTPLNAILGFSEALALGYGGALNPRQGEYISHIRDGGELLLKLVNDLLTLSVLDADESELQVAETHICELIEAVEPIVSGLSENRHMELRFQVNGGPSDRVLIDKIRVEQILINLISNAIKYGHDGGNIWVDFDEQPAGVLKIAVRDDGIGIAERQFSNIFEPFNRAGMENSGIEGVGAGLAICRKLVEAMGGGIDFVSTLGTGSTFWVEIPCRGRERGDLVPQPLSGRRRNNGRAASPL